MEVSSRIRSAVLTALGILVALGVVAIASRGSTSAARVGDRHASDVLLDIIFALYLVGIFVGAAVLLYMIYLHRKFQREGIVPRRNFRQTAIGMLLLLLVGVFLARRLGNQNSLRRPEVTEQFSPTTNSSATTSSIQPVAETGFAWVPVIVTIALLALAVVGWWWGGARRRRARGDLREPLLVQAIASALDESLDDLRAERDPRRAVIAAYARLERVLARYGLPRRKSEAPLEYLERMLGDVAVTPAAARRLTGLFERARFSQHDVRIEMKEEAIEALETVRDDLRAAEAEAERERQRLLAVPPGGVAP